MIQIIIFSFNRALQLDTLLRSLVMHWKSPDYCVDIIYNSSDDFFQNGYDILIGKYGAEKRISFHKESACDKSYSIKELFNLYNLKKIMEHPKIRNPRSNFRSLLIDILQKNTAENVMFMTDDAMYIDDVSISQDILDWLKKGPKDRQYVLRFGMNTNDRPDSVCLKNDYLEWRFTDYAFVSDWGYTFSVDAHIYDKNLIIHYLKKYVFINPNTLEGFVSARMREHKDANFARCVMNPKLLSFPINMVQTEIGNESCDVDCNYLNRKFIEGYTLEYPIPDQIKTFQVYPDYLMLKKDEIVEKKYIGKPKRNEV